MESSSNTSSIPSKQIVHKGKTKTIPEFNPNPKACEFFIIAKMRYCKFEKHSDSQLCIYHIPNDNTADVSFVDCPIDPSHRVLANNLKRHVRVCNKLGEKQRLISNVWYKEKINKVESNEDKIKKKLDEIKEPEDLKKLYELRWEDLTELEYASTIDKIIQCYETLKYDYRKYSVKEELESMLVSADTDTEEEFKMSLAGLEINQETDFHCTKDLAKGEKNGKQNKAISDVLRKFNLLSKNKVYIEFGAGRGGLSHYINSLTNQESVHVLLEREGIRYKLDNHADKLTRFRTDILDFDINYIDSHVKNNEHTQHLVEDQYSLIGVAKHICGCALDLSLSCLFNYSEIQKVEAVCMATCCHHICIAEYVNNLDFYSEYLKLSIREIILLFKATSWIFGAICSTSKEDSAQIKSNKIFVERGIKKSYIGLITKYIVDLSRVFFLVSKDFKVFYLKYCSNEVTTENNLILAINNTKI